jgi:hypothetical protein
MDNTLMCTFDMDDTSLTAVPQPHAFNTNNTHAHTIDTDNTLVRAFDTNDTVVRLQHTYTRLQYPCACALPQCRDRIDLCIVSYCLISLIESLLDCQ